MRSLSTIALLLLSGIVSREAYAKPHRWRIHVVASSFSFVEDSSPNSLLASIASRAGYDAVWDGVGEDDDFPTFFKTAKVRNATGRTVQSTKGGNGNCSADLVYDPNPTHQPGVGIYFRNKSKIAIKIPTAHRASVSPGSALVHNDSQPSPCNVVYHANYAPTPEVSTEWYPHQKLPKDPGSDVVEPPNGWIAFEVNTNNPSYSQFFKFYQRGTFDGSSSTSVWFANVTVEKDPPNQLPSPIDPLKSFSYIPPDNSHAPPPPPNYKPATPAQESRWLRNPFETQIRDIIKDLMKGWTDIQNSLNKSFENSQLNYSLNVTTNTVTMGSLGGTPTSGSVSSSISTGGGKAQNAVKSATVATGESGAIVFKLPTPLVKALNKGKATTVKLSSTFKPLFGKSGTSTTTFAVPKRK